MSDFWCQAISGALWTWVMLGVFWGALRAWGYVHRETQRSVHRWRLETFGSGADRIRVFGRMLEEVAELGEKLGADSFGAARLRALAQEFQVDGAVWPSGDRAKIADELADVLIVLYGLAGDLGADLLTEVDKKMKINRRRRWTRGREPGLGRHVREVE